MATAIAEAYAQNTAQEPPQEEHGVDASSTEQHGDGDGAGLNAVAPGEGHQTPVETNGAEGEGEKGEKPLPEQNAVAPGETKNDGTGGGSEEGYAETNALPETNTNEETPGQQSSLAPHDNEDEEGH